jgi:vacuolar-type H+-ATPase subunit I/STV1
MDSLEERMSRTERLVAHMADILDGHRSDIRTLYTSQIFISESVEKLGKSLVDLADRQKITDERLAEVTDKLDALIDLVDRHTKEHHARDKEQQ